MPATDYANEYKRAVPDLGIPGNVGEAAEDHAAAMMTWPRRLKKLTTCASTLLNITDLFFVTRARAAHQEREACMLLVAERAYSGTEARLCRRIWRWQDITCLRAHT